MLDRADPAPTGHGSATAKATTIGGLSGESSSRFPRSSGASSRLLIGLLWWFLFHRYPRWTTWLIGAVPFLAALFVCLHVPRAAAAVELLIDDASIDACCRYGVRVIFFVATIVLTVVVVVVTKGSFERLGRLRLRMLWLLFLGRDPDRARGGRVPEGPHRGPRLRDPAALLRRRPRVLRREPKVRGMTLISVGVALNVLVIALNQGMPTKDDVAIATAAKCTCRSSRR